MQTQAVIEPKTGYNSLKFNITDNRNYNLLTVIGASNRMEWQLNCDIPGRVGRILIDSPFVYSGGKTAIYVTAIVSGDLELHSTRSGGLGGSFKLEVRRNVRGSIFVRDETDLGGMAEKVIKVNALVTGNLTVVMGGRTNFYPGSVLDIWGSRKGECTLSGYERDTFTDDIDFHGHRTITINRN